MRTGNRKIILFFCYFGFVLYIIFIFHLFMLELYVASFIMIIFLIICISWVLFFSKYRYLKFGTKKLGYIYDYTYHPFYGGRRARYPRTIPQVDIIVYDNGFEKRIHSRDYFDKKLSKYIKDNLELINSSDSKKLYVDVYFIGKRYYVDFSSIRID